MRGFEVCEAEEEMNALIRLYDNYPANAPLYYVEAKNFQCQYDSKIDNVCTCKPRRNPEYFNAARQVYRSQRYGARDYRDIGIGSVKPVYKKQIRRIYLPATEDRGTGSNDITSFVHRRRKHRSGGYYNCKITSSKCVGGAIENVVVPVLNKKVSPIIQTVSGSTSPKISSYKNSKVISNLPIDKNHTPNIWTHKIGSLKEDLAPTNKIKIMAPNNKDDKNLSSDSLVQNVHNFDKPSRDEISMSNDFIENNLQKEYREIFTTNRRENIFASKEKLISNIRSTSLLRQRFEDLGRGLNKKENKEESVTLKVSSKISVPSQKDVSITSDPPSLEARSYSSTKIHSPISSFAYNTQQRKSYEKKYTEEEMTSNFPTDIDNEYQDVKGMFKLWEEKFNFDNKYHNKLSSNISITKKQKKKVNIDVPVEDSKSKKKKEGRKFLFFGKKKKKLKQPFTSKQGVTTGRCEVGDGLTIKIGNANTRESTISRKKYYNYQDNSITNKAWFRQFVNNRIESQNSVRIRWNNNMYTTSSSTVFELMDCVYKNTGILFSSKSEVCTVESSWYQSPQVNYMQQSIQAWMVPKTVTDTVNPNNFKTIRVQKKNNPAEIIFPNKRWFIDKSKAFAHKIELVLHSKNLVRSKKFESSEYIVIDIPESYFSDTSSDEKGTCQTSDEQVYNIVEYETMKSNSYLRKMNVNNQSDDSKDKIRKTRNKEIESQVVDHRNGVIQDTSVYVPKGCDVISVGIITQRDLRDTKKPILKIRDFSHDSPQALLQPNTCEFAQSFLQDYYRNCLTLEPELLSLCVSDNKLCNPLEINSMVSFNKPGDDQAKSCSNIYDDYHTSTIVSSCETSSCSHCMALEEGKRKQDSKKSNKFFDKLMKKNNEQSQVTNEKRVWPKDSIEVFKRRQVYAKSNKSKRETKEEQSDSFCRSNELNEQNDKTSRDNSKRHKKKRKLQVLFPDCKDMDDILKEQLLYDKTVEGILSYKGAKSCDDCKAQQSKQTQIIPQPTKEIPQPPCKDTCVQEKRPACSNKNSSTCNIPTPPACPVGLPSPCQKPCPPSPPPCQMIPPCLLSPTRDASPKLRSNSTQKPVLPRKQTPRTPSPKRSPPCICPKRKSACNIPKCPVSIKEPSQTSPHISKSSLQQTIPKSRSSSCKCSKSSSSDKVKKASNEFPWPNKKDVSNLPSKVSMTSLQNTKYLEKTSSKCIAALKRLIQKISSSSIKQNNCKLDCANRPLLQTQGVVTTPPPSQNKNPTKTGLHLRKLPMPKQFSKEYLPKMDEGEGVIRLNSREKIRIKLKQFTPSTEEIREGCNIKVQDEDGQTLYERRDYRKIDRNRMQFVKDLYRDSHVQVQRLSTPNVDKVIDERPQQISQCRSDVSISNAIEINVNLKFKQGDKTTEVNVKKDADLLNKELDDCDLIGRSDTNQEVFVVQDNQKKTDEIEKADFDINIMIKNYKAPVKYLPKDKHISLSKDDFSKKISKKFQTVSTGYSDIIEKQTFSIHRATTDLTNSLENNRSLNKVGLELSSKDVIATNETGRSSTRSNNKRYMSLEVISTKNDFSLNKTIRGGTNVDSIEASNEKSIYSLSLTNDDNITSDDTNAENKSLKEIKKYSKQDKKNILKQIFENSSEVSNKSKMQEIRQILHAVLTSDSSRETVELNKELVKDNRRDSLKSNFLNNIINFDDNTSNSTKITNSESEVLYPTKDISEYTDSSVQENVGCLCNHLAAKLNVNKTCCCRKHKVDKGVFCNLIDVKKNVDTETQYSDLCKEKLLTDKNISNKHSKEDLLKSSNIVNSNSQRMYEPSNILQLNETKKAVLEIYTERIDSTRKRFAKLPKFVCDIEKHIVNDESIEKKVSYCL